MPEEILRNPAVNPVVDTDGSSNAEHRRYNSTTDDLLDRIRQAVEAINGGGGGGIGSQNFFQVIDRWIYYFVDGQPFSIHSPVLFHINNGVMQPLKIIDMNGGSLEAIPPNLLGILESPHKLSHTGRIDGNLTESLEFHPYNNRVLPDFKSVDISKKNFPVFKIDIVVLPDSMLNDDINENYFSITIHEVEKKYYLESFNGLPIVNKLTFEDLDGIDNITISANEGIKLEYIIISTYPNES